MCVCVCVCVLGGHAYTHTHTHIWTHDKVSPASAGPQLQRRGRERLSSPLKLYLPALLPSHASPHTHTRGTHTHAAHTRMRHTHARGRVCVRVGVRACIANCRKNVPCIKNSSVKFFFTMVVAMAPADQFI